VIQAAVDFTLDETSKRLQSAFENHDDVQAEEKTLLVTILIHCGY